MGANTRDIEYGEIALMAATLYTLLQAFPYSMERFSKGFQFNFPMNGSKVEVLMTYSDKFKVPQGNIDADVLKTNPPSVIAIEILRTDANIEDTYKRK